MTRPALTRLVAVVACAVLLGACGSDDDSSPNRSSIDRDGRLWATLDDGDKSALISFAKDRFIQARPTLVGDILAYRTSLLRDRMDRAYARPANRSRSIYEVYRRVDAALENEQNRRALQQARDRSD